MFTQELKAMEQEINILKTVNLVSTGKLIALLRMKPDSNSALYITGLIINKCQLMQEEREKQRTKKKS